MKEEMVYDMLLKESEVTWQDILHQLVKEEQMDPWDVDLTKLTQKYIVAVKKMKEMDYFISGKVLLASAILLKMKSNRLVQEDITNFDAFLFHQENQEFEELGEYLPYQEHKVEIPRLGVRTPQARKRKVSLSDLIGALEKALRVDTRRKLRLQKFLAWKAPEIPERKVDIILLIDEIYKKLALLFQQKKIIPFSELDPGKGKEETILTLLPLLYLHSGKKVNLEQEEAFAEIHIHQALS
ncbi:MAG: segregation and condensation protein A [archaeon GW2011_AR17]|nr:MAG: segregation and condensation protein A [archaeon GW2011_AR17]MBS3154477.1 segregation/condensation protein A [Candidatus Woesearchaeota archaeon]HIH59388.1 segregation/condensation protein A [Nanoarchaeota archaeon]HII14524.1 segregation/condensation protein A [Nanoarchaeota archaeon]HIJ04512.1 segregation/condensation protein A [Nanoarchaeota archaeon]